MDQILEISKKMGSQAHQLYHQGKYEDAIKLYKEMLQKNPKDDLSMIGIADCLFSLKNYEEAKQSYEEFLQEGSNQFKDQGYCNYAWCLQKLGENYGIVDSVMELALKSLKEESKCIQVVCAISDYFINKLKTYESEMQEEESETCLRVVRDCIDKIDDIDPLYTDGLLIKGNYYTFINTPQSATEVYNEFIKIKPQDYRGYYYLANQLSSQNQQQQAISLYLKSDLYNESDKNFALKQAMKCAAKLASVDPILNIMKIKLELYPKSSIVYQETVTALLQITKYNAAIMLCQNWTNDCPDDVTGWQFLSELSYQFKVYDVSLVAYTNLCRLTEYKDHTCINVLGALHLIKKEFEQCFDCCLKSLNAKYDYSFAFRNLSEFRKDYSKEKFFEFYDHYTSKYPFNTAVNDYMNKIEAAFPEDVEYLKKKFSENETTVKVPQKTEEVQKSQ